MKAILFYGYCWKEPDELIRIEDIAGWEDRLLKARGHINPWEQDIGRYDGMPEHEQLAAAAKWTVDNRPAIDAYEKEKRYVRREFGCKIEIHYDGDIQLPMVAIAVSVTRVMPGRPQSIGSTREEVQWGRKVLNFCNQLKIEPPEGQEPRWWLVASSIKESADAR